MQSTKKPTGSLGRLVVSLFASWSMVFTSVPAVALADEPSSGAVPLAEEAVEPAADNGGAAPDSQGAEQDVEGTEGTEGGEPEQVVSEGDGHGEPSGEPEAGEPEVGVVTDTTTGEEGTTVEGEPSGEPAPAEPSEGAAEGGEGTEAQPVERTFTWTDDVTHLSVRVVTSDTDLQAQLEGASLEVKAQTEGDEFAAMDAALEAKLGAKADFELFRVRLMNAGSEIAFTEATPAEMTVSLPSVEGASAWRWDAEKGELVAFTEPAFDGATLTGKAAKLGEIAHVKALRADEETAGEGEESDSTERLSSPWLELDGFPGTSAELAEGTYEVGAALYGELLMGGEPTGAPAAALGSGPATLSVASDGSATLTLALASGGSEAPQVSSLGSGEGVSASLGEGGSSATFRLASCSGRYVLEGADVSLYGGAMTIPTLYLAVDMAGAQLKTYPEDDSTSIMGGLTFGDAAAPESSVDSLEPGEYLVVANLYVPAEKNEILGVNAFLTSPDLPPTKAVLTPASMTVDENGVATVHLDVRSVGFTLQDLGTSEGVLSASVQRNDRVYDAANGVVGRIYHADITLANLSGGYDFTGSSAYAIPLKDYMNYPLHLSVDLANAKNSATFVSKNFTAQPDSVSEYDDPTVGLHVESYDAETNAKLANATFSVTRLVSGDEWAAIKAYFDSTLYASVQDVFAPYVVSLKDADGSEIDLSKCDVSYLYWAETGAIFGNLCSFNTYLWDGASAALLDEMTSDRSQVSYKLDVTATGTYVCVAMSGIVLPDETGHAKRVYPGGIRNSLSLADDATGLGMTLNVVDWWTLNIFTSRDFDSVSLVASKASSGDDVDEATLEAIKAAGSSFENPTIETSYRVSPVDETGAWSNKVYGGSGAYDQPAGVLTNEYALPVNYDSDVVYRIDVDANGAKTATAVEGVTVSDGMARFTIDSNKDNNRAYDYPYCFWRGATGNTDGTGYSYFVVVNDGKGVTPDPDPTPGESVTDLAPGTYTVTANLYVPGELNEQIPGTDAYLTNPANPLGIGGVSGIPTSPVSDNATLVVDENGVVTLQLDVVNPVFTLQQIAGASNATATPTAYADIDPAAMGTGAYATRISQLEIGLKDTSGVYTFSSCVEYPTILGQTWNVPLTLEVSFDGIDHVTPTPDPDPKPVERVLAPGTYGITANLYVPAESNTVLGVDAYLTSASMPPVSPVAGNATVVVSEDGTVTLTVPVVNPVFSLQAIGGGTNAEVADTEFAYDVTGQYGDHEGRISSVTFTLADDSGTYAFADCTEYPTLLGTDMHMPLTLSVDWSSAKRNYVPPQPGETHYEQTLTSGDVSVAVQTTEAWGAKLEGATLTASAADEATTAAVAEKLAALFDGAAPEFAAFATSVADADGAPLAFGGNAQLTLSVSNAYDKATLYRLEADGSLTELGASEGGAAASGTVSGVSEPGTLVIVNTSGAVVFNVTKTFAGEGGASLTVKSTGENKSPTADKLEGWQLFSSVATEGAYADIASTAIEQSEGAAPGSLTVYSLGLDEPSAWARYGTGPAILKHLGGGDATLTASIPAEAGQTVYLVTRTSSGTTLTKVATAEEDGFVSYELVGLNDKTSDADLVVTRMWNAGSGKYWSMNKPKDQTEKTPLVFFAVASAAGTDPEPEPGVLAPGTYQITANLYVPAEFNTVLGVDAFLTNPALPPLQPVADNATLVVKEDGAKYLKIPVSNSIFTLQEVGTGEGFEVVGTARDDAAYGPYTGRVTELYLRLDTDAETLRLTGNTEYPTLLGQVWQTPLGVSLSYDSATKVSDSTDIEIPGTDPDPDPEPQPGVAVAPSGAALTYTGSEQTGVAAGEGYELSGVTSATAAGSYEATATLAEGYVWADGTTEPKAVSWSIAPAQLTATFVDESVAADGTPAYAVSVSGFVGGENERTASGYEAPVVAASDRPITLEPGSSYTLTPSGGRADNYAFTYKAGTLTVQPRMDEGVAPGTYRITANLYVPGELNEQLPGANAYLTNPANPLGIGGVSGAPTTPVSDNATMVVKEDGTKYLVIPVENPVFTLQAAASGENIDVIGATRDDQTYADAAGTASRQGRITMLYLQLKDDSGSYQLGACTEFPTLLGVDWNVPLRVSADFASMVKTSDSTDTSYFPGYVEPEQPTDPDKPDQPDQPSQPTDPDRPSTPGEGEQGTHLAAGTYTVTANIWLSDRASTGLPLMPYLTSGEFPPMNPVTGNATLVVDESGHATVTVPILVQDRVLYVNALGGLDVVGTAYGANGLSSVTIDLGVITDLSGVLTIGCTATVTMGSLASTISGITGQHTWPATFQLVFSGVPTSGNAGSSADVEKLLAGAGATSASGAGEGAGATSNLGFLAQAVSLATDARLAAASGSLEATDAARAEATLASAGAAGALGELDPEGESGVRATAALAMAASLGGTTTQAHADALSAAFLSKDAA